jgi:predicted amidophosphoribosyltransferase
MVHAALDQLLALLVGRRCPGCGSAAVVVPCVECRAQLRASPPVDDAAWRDDGVVGRLVRSAKHGQWRAGGRVLGSLIAAERPQVIPDADVITWVPADRRRRAARGGHLPARVARELGRRLDRPVAQLLAPTARRRPQRGLDRAARRANVVGAFVPTAAATRVPIGSRVLVVDDVRTTGATLAAARAALQLLPIRVEVLAIVGVDRACLCGGPCERALGARNFGSGIERPLPIHGRTLPKGSSLRAPRPP